MAEKKKNQMIPFKELPVRFKVLRIVFLVVELPGLIMVIIGTALGIAGIGVLLGGLFTFMIPALVIAIIDYKLETKYRKELEAKQANPEAQVETKPVEAKPEPASQEPAQEPQSIPETWICPNCGAQVQGKFCVECGAKKPEPMAEPQPVVEQVVEPEPEPEPQPEPVFEEEPVEEPPVQEPIKEEPPINNEPKKKNKKGLIIILIIIGALVLVGGGVGAGIAIYSNMKNKGNEEGPSDDDYSYVVPTSSSTPRPSSSSAKPSSSSKPSSSAITSKAPKETMIDICNNVFARGARYYDDYPEDYNYYYSSGTYSGFYAAPAFGSLVDPVESNLRVVVETVANNLPSYLHAIDSLHSDTWEEGVPGYFQNFTDGDNQTKVELGSYIYHGDDGDDIVCQIYVHYNLG